jgi:hypothetical protein
MKKVLLFSIPIILSCNAAEVKVKEDSIDSLLRKSDSVLIIHERVRIHNAKVLNDLIEKYSDTLKKTK